MAGNREHEEPGIGDRVERFLGEVLEQLGFRLSGQGARVVTEDSGEMDDQ